MKQNPNEPVLLTNMTIAVGHFRPGEAYAGIPTSDAKRHHARRPINAANLNFGFRYAFYHYAVSLLLAVGCGMFSGCTTVTSAGYDANDKVDLLANRTYAVLPWPRVVAMVSSFGTTDAVAAVTYAAKDAMSRNGYKEAALGDADVVVNVRGTQIPDNDIAHWGLSYAGSEFWSARYNPKEPIPVVQGEIIMVVEIFQKTDSKLVWVGWRQCRPVLAPDSVWYAGTIKSILESFPPAPGS